MSSAKTFPACGNDGCTISSGICGALTFGHGELDDDGYWEHPCILCASAWLRWDDGEEDTEVWPKPPPIFTFQQMIQVLEVPMGKNPTGRLEDTDVMGERVRLHHMYKSLRTTDNTNRSDGMVLTDISNCLEVARAMWLEEQFKLRG